MESKSTRRGFFGLVSSILAGAAVVMQAQPLVTIGTTSVGPLVDQQAQLAHYIQWRQWHRDFGKVKEGTRPSGYPDGIWRSSVLKASNAKHSTGLNYNSIGQPVYRKSS